MTEIVVIQFCNYDSDTNRKISIIDYKPHIQCDSYTRKFSIDIIGNPSNFYKALAGGYDAHILDKFLSFSNGYLNIMTPILIDLINWLPLEKTKNISLFEWGNVVFEKEVNIAIKCSKFCFTNNTCKQNATFTLYNNANSINFTKSSFCRDFSFKTIQPQENVTKDMICCDCIFGSENQNAKIDFSNFQFDGVVDFSNTTFGLEINFENVYFDKIANFSNAKFNHKAIFAKTSFKDEANFNNAVFCDSADFNGATFDKDIYFHRAIFKQDLQIYRAIFERVVNFYFATFENIVNFSACVIKNPRFLNFVGIDTKNISQEKMKQYINQKAKDESEIKENIKRNRTEINLALQHAQNLKDSFRVIKDTLLTQNNLLEAQNWHKLELYANELELEYKLEQGQNKKSNQKESDKFDWNKFKKICDSIFTKIIYCICIIEGLPFFTVIMVAYCGYNFIINFGSYIKIATKFVKNFFKYIKSLEWKKIKLNKQKNNALDFTLWIDTVILKLYRHTSDHHTNFTTVLNFTVGTIVVYGLFLLLVNCILPCMANYNGEFVSFFIIIVLGVIFLVIFRLCAIGKNMFYDKLTLLFLSFIFVVCILLLVMPFLIHILCCLIIYLVCLGLFYFIFNIGRIAYCIRVVIYVIFLIILILKPQLINPFIGIFSSDKLFENRLEEKLNTLNPNIVMNLSKIAQKEFISQDEYIAKHNISLIEVSEARKIVIANKIGLNNIVAYLFDNDKKVGYFKEILVTLENNPSDLIDIIKNIDNKENNNAIFYDMKKLLNSDFIRTYDSINYDVYKNFSALSITLKDEDYQIFALQENQTKLKNILSLINLDKTLHLQEIKQIIDYDKVMNNTIKSTNIIYSIILLLCIFSLQKTARKNSIIPS